MGQCWRTETRLDPDRSDMDGTAVRRRGRGCCRRLAISKRLIRIYLATFTTYFASAYVVTMIFPFLPFMVMHVLPGLDETSVGKYAGYLAGAMFFGRFCSNYIWGAIADRKGRKPVLIISVLLTGITALAFGFSVNFPMAVVLRFFSGVTNGCTATVKAVISESSNDNNQAFGVSVLTTALTLGYIVGPAVSGVIADPVQEYNITTNSTFIDFFNLFPYSPPCIVAFFICLIAAFFLLFMPETLKKKKLNYNPLKTDSTTSNMTEIEGESDELGQGSGTGDLVDDSAETGNSNERVAGGNDTSGSPLQTRDQESNPNASTSLNQSRESPELLKTNKTSNEVVTHPRKKRRKSSIVFAFFPGRRDSMTPLVLRVSRSQRAQAQHQFETLQPSSVVDGPENRGDDDSLQLEELNDAESVNSSDRVQLIHQDREESAVNNGKDSFGSKVVVKLRKFKHSVILSLKDLKYFMSHRTTRLVVLVYTVFSFYAIGFDDVYSLWCATPAYYGGLGFSLRDIGISLSIVGACQLPFSLFFFPVMEQKLGAINSFHVTAITLIALVMLLPNLHFFVPLNQDILLWFLLCLTMLVIRVALQTSFSSTFIFINNSVSFDKLGSINGFAMSVTALVRTVAPVFASSLYSVSLSETTRAIGFPLDYHLIFIIFGMIILTTDIMVACLPKSVNRQLVQAKNKPVST